MPIASQARVPYYPISHDRLWLIPGKPPSAFPQERLRIDFQEVVQVGPALAAVLEGLLEPLVEDRISASDALATLNGQNPGREVARCESTTQHIFFKCQFLVRIIFYHHMFVTGQEISRQAHALRCVRRGTPWR